MAEAERIENANKACLGAGVNTIASFSDGSAESIFIDEWYELLVESELSLYPWRFATKTAVLQELNAAPDTAYNVAHQLPNDVVAVDTVLVNDKPIDYDRYQDQIHSNNTSGDTLILKYRFRCDERYWNPYFRLLVIYRLATMLSFSISRKDEIAASMKGLADEHWRRAKTMDAQSQTNQKANLQKITRSRGGKLDKFWRDR